MKTSEVISLLVFVVLLVAIVKLVNKVQALDRNMRAIAARIDSAGQDQVREGRRICLWFDSDLIKFGF